MKQQKKNIVPKVNNIAVTDWDAATSFTSDFIEFDASIPWSLDVQDYADMTAGSPTITILHSNKQDGEYKAYKSLATDIDITVSGNRNIFDDSFFARFMKIQYVSGGSTGTFSLQLSK
jgi:hypothetical protein